MAETQPDLLPAAKNIVECRLEDAPEKWEQLDDAINATEKRYAECEHVYTRPIFAKGKPAGRIIGTERNNNCPECGMPLEVGA